jgi:hypothetical protein
MVAELEEEVGDGACYDAAESTIQAFTGVNA